MTGSPTIQLNLAGSQILQKSQLISHTAATLLDLTGITGAPQKLLILNIDTANPVTVALDSGMSNKTDVIPAGDFILISPFAATRYLEATTADVNIEIWAAGT